MPTNEPKLMPLLLIIIIMVSSDQSSTSCTTRKFLRTPVRSWWAPWSTLRRRFTRSKATARFHFPRLWSWRPSNEILRLLFKTSHGLPSVQFLIQTILHACRSWQTWVLQQNKSLCRQNGCLLFYTMSWGGGLNKFQPQSHTLWHTHCNTSCHMCLCS